MCLQKYVFEKCEVPAEPNKRAVFISKLATIGVSLRSYNTSLEQTEITR